MTSKCSGCAYIAPEHEKICAVCPHRIGQKSQNSTKQALQYVLDDLKPQNPPVMRNSERIYDIMPVAKPRMTRSDKWKTRKCVLKYRDFADKCRELKIILNDSGDHVTFVIPMPDTWSKRRKIEMYRQPHIHRLDTDNLLKALQDALHKQDCHIWDIRITKIWGYVGAIEIRRS